MRKPLLIDLYCGLGGWSRPFIENGWQAIGFDIERHDYGTGSYPGQLVLQDVCTLEGRQLVDADMIVASSPCQQFSYRAMPWKQARALSPSEVGKPEPTWWEKTEQQMSKADMKEWAQWRERFPKPPPVLGIKLFWQAFRLQREIHEATGRWVPLVAENVRGAQRWVSPAKAAYGSFFMWGDVFQHGNRIFCGDRPKIGMPYLIAPSGPGGKANPDGTDHPQGSWFKISDSKERGSKNPNFRFDGSGRSFQSESVKNAALNGGSWFNIGSPGQIGAGSDETRARTAGGVLSGSGTDTFGWSKATPLRNNNSHSPARKAASAMIAMIPYPLAEFLAVTMKPECS